MNTGATKMTMEMIERLSELANNTDEQKGPVGLLNKKDLSEEECQFILNTLREFESGGGI